MKIYRKEKSANCTTNFVCGLPFASKKRIAGKIITSHLFGLCKTEYKNGYIYKYILGIRIRKIPDIRAITAQSLHQVQQSLKSYQQDINAYLQKNTQAHDIGEIKTQISELQQSLIQTHQEIQTKMDTLSNINAQTHHIDEIKTQICETQKNLLILRDDIAREVQRILCLPALAQFNFNPLFYQPIVVAHHQKVFPKYKNINAGKSVVLCATGTTFSCFNKSMLKDAVYVGVNQSYLSDSVDLDYLFVTDFTLGLRGKGDLITKKKSPKTKKFFGIMPIMNPDDPATFMQFPVKFIEDNSAEYFFCTESGVFAWDLSYFPLTSFSSVIHPTLQFVLYTHPRRIYLVGCDCSGGHFNSDIHIEDDAHKQLLETWIRNKKAISIWYPDVEVISVNPIGLKGLFRDVYTEPFLAQHPEINRDEVEILTEGEI